MINMVAIWGLTLHTQVAAGDRQGTLPWPSVHRNSVNIPPHKTGIEIWWVTSNPLKRSTIADGDNVDSHTLLSEKMMAVALSASLHRMHLVRQVHPGCARCHCQTSGKHETLNLPPALSMMSKLCCTGTLPFCSFCRTYFTGVIMYRIPSGSP